MAPHEQLERCWMLDDIERDETGKNANAGGTRGPPGETLVACWLTHSAAAAARGFIKRR